MEVNTRLRDEIFKIIRNQINANNPPETKVTYHRLIALGYSKFETNQLIGKCVASEIFNVMKEKQPYNEKRYVENLKRLPKEPI